MACFMTVFHEIGFESPLFFLGGQFLSVLLYLSQNIKTNSRGKRILKLGPYIHLL